jgi:RNA polymerase sigma factor (sigma-70 family)
MVSVIFCGGLRIIEQTNASFMSNQINKTEFLEVLENHKKIVYKIAFAYTQNKMDRDDLIQEIIIQLWNSFHRYDSTYKYSTWIYRIALNVSISFFRKDKKQTRIALSEKEHFLNIAQEESQYKEIESKLNLMHGFISELKEIDKAIILLFLEDKSHQEIAEIIGISKSNVGTRIGRIKIILQEKFNQTKK